jgi:hypothetical protein
MANPLLNGLILGVLLTGIILNIRQVIMLKPELEWLESFQGQGADKTVDEHLELKDSPPFLSSAGPKLLSSMARMLSESRNKSGKFSLSAQAMRTLLDGIASRLEESRDLARYFVGLSIFAICQSQGMTYLLCLMTLKQDLRHRLMEWVLLFPLHYSV